MWTPQVNGCRRLCICQQYSVIVVNVNEMAEEEKRWEAQGAFVLVADCERSCHQYAGKQERRQGNEIGWHISFPSLKETSWVDFTFTIIIYLAGNKENEVSVYSNLQSCIARKGNANVSPMVASGFFACGCMSMSRKKFCNASHLQDTKLADGGGSRLLAFKYFVSPFLAQKRQ